MNHRQSLLLLLGVFVISLFAQSSASAEELQIPDYRLETYVLQETSLDATNKKRIGRAMVSSKAETGLLYYPEEGGAKSPDRLGTFYISMSVKPTAEGKFGVENEVSFHFPRERWPVTRGDAEVVTSRLNFEADPNDLSSLDEVEPRQHQELVDSASTPLINGMLERFDGFSFHQQNDVFRQGIRGVVRQFMDRELELLPSTAKALITHYPQIVEQYKSQKSGYPLQEPSDE